MRTEVRRVRPVILLMIIGESIDGRHDEASPLLSSALAGLKAGEAARNVIVIVVFRIAVAWTLRRVSSFPCLLLLAGLSVRGEKNEAPWIFFRCSRSIESKRT